MPITEVSRLTGSFARPSITFSPMSRRRIASKTAIRALLAVAIVGGLASNATAGELKGGLTWSPSAPRVLQAAPRHGDWRRYVLLPSTRVVCPPRVATPTGSVIANSNALVCRGGGVASLRSIAGPAQIIVDFGREMSGYLQVKLAAGSQPGAVGVSYSEMLAYLSSGCDLLGVESFAPPSLNLPQCPRTIQATGAEQTFDDPSPRPGFRYVVLTAPGPLNVRSVTVHRYTAFPGDLRTGYRGYFLSSDDALNQYWYDGTYTAQVDTIAARDAGVYYEGLRAGRPDETVMVDGAKRDRYVWYDIAGPKTLLPLLYGDRRTPRNTLAVLAAGQDQKGFMPACVTPKSFYGASCDVSWTDATPWWVIALGEYWAWTRDDTFLRQMSPRVTRALTALLGCRGGDGLVGPCHGTLNYLGAFEATPSTYLNAVSYQALRTAAKLLRPRHPRQAARFDRAAIKLAHAINAHLWDANARAYRQSVGHPASFPQDANVLASRWGIADRSRARSALAYVRTHLWTSRGVRSGQADSPALIADWITYFEMAAYARFGDVHSLRRLMDASWGFMHLQWKPIPGPLGNSLEPPSTTGWEHSRPSGNFHRGAESSLAHVWSEGAAIVETTSLLGVSPTAPGFRRWAVRPLVRGSRVSWAEGSVPTARGPIRVRWAISKRGFTMRIDAPAGSAGVVYVPTLGKPRTVWHDGRIVHAGARSGYVAVRGDGAFCWSSAAKRCKFG